MEAGFELGTLFQEGDEQINGDGTPDRGAHGVGAGAVKGFAAQLLLDPFEEQFDLPAQTPCAPKSGVPSPFICSSPS